MQYTINKLLNEYVNAIPREVYERIPKAVWAAVAISFATCGGDNGFGQVVPEILGEWLALHLNGIVPQPVPPALLLAYPKPDEE